MNLGGNQGDRLIPTGGLMVDGSPTSIELRHETCSYEVTADGSNVATGSLPLFATDKGVISRGIKDALAGGHQVTAKSRSGHDISFEKRGSMAMGFSKTEGLGGDVLMSAGRFGLKSALGLESNFHTGLGRQEYFPWFTYRPGRIVGRIISALQDL